MAGTTDTRSLSTDATSPLFESVTVNSNTYRPILASGVSTTLPTDGGIATQAITTYSIVTATDVGTNTSNGFTTTFTTTSIVTNPAVYSSLLAAASTATKTTTSVSSHAASASSSVSKKSKSSSNLSTIIPAVVVPIVIILIATFAAFWFFMRRRHRRDLKNQPAFVMAAKTEKLTSTTNSLSSDHEDYKPPTVPTKTGTASYNEKPLPFTQTRDVPSRPSESSSRSRTNYPMDNVGVAKTSNVRDEQRPSPLLPPIRTDSSSPQARHIVNFSNKASPTTAQASRSANPHLNSSTPHNSVIPSPKNTSGRGPPAGVGTSSHALVRNRSQSLTNPGAANPNRSNPNLNNSYRNGPAPTQRPPTAPTSGFRGPPPPSFSPIAQQQRSFSPSGHRAAPPPPIKAPLPGTNGGAFINEPQYSPIVRDAPKAKRPSVVVPPSQQSRGISYGSHTSPLLPSPQSARDRDHNLTAENLRIARLANTSRLGFDAQSPTSPERPRNQEDNISEISAPLESDDGKSDVSSLDELEKFNFERDTRGSGSGSGHNSALGSLPGARSGSAMNTNSPILGRPRERPWS